MTASVQVLAPVSAPAPNGPLSLQVSHYAEAVASGAVPVDIRSHRKRQADGALIGALALDAAEALDLLTPGSRRHCARPPTTPAGFSSPTTVTKPNG